MVIDSTVIYIIYLVHRNWVYGQKCHEHASLSINHPN